MEHQIHSYPVVVSFIDSNFEAQVQQYVDLSRYTSTKSEVISLCELWVLNHPDFLTKLQQSATTVQKLFWKFYFGAIQAFQQFRPDLQLTVIGNTQMVSLESPIASGSNSPQVYTLEVQAPQVGTITQYVPPVTCQGYHKNGKKCQAKAVINGFCKTCGKAAIAKQTADLTNQGFLATHAVNPDVLSNHLFEVAVAVDGTNHMLAKYIQTLFRLKKLDTVIVVDAKGPYYFWNDMTALWAKGTLESLVLNVQDVICKRFDEVKRKLTDRNQIDALDTFWKKVGNGGFLKTSLNQLLGYIQDKETYYKLNNFEYLIPMKSFTVVDIRTKEVRERQKEDYFTFTTPCDYKPNADQTKIQTFINYFCCEVPERVEKIHVSIGYCLTGSTREQVFFLTHQEGSGGKSTLSAILNKAFGDDIVDVADIASLCGKNVRGPSPDLIDIVQKRLIFFPEPDANDKINMTRLKQLTGEQALKMRNLYAEAMKYLVRCKSWFLSNYAMNIDMTLRGGARRVLEEPAFAVFAMNEKDRLEREQELAAGTASFSKVYMADLNFLSNLTQEDLEGVVAWGIDGAHKWYHSEGLQKFSKDYQEAVQRAEEAGSSILPAVVPEGINRSKEDDFTEFFNNTFDLTNDPRHFVKASTVQKLAKACNSGFVPQFVKSMMIAKGSAHKKVSEGFVYLNIVQKAFVL